MKKHAGFSLIELMIVIVIIGILSAVSIPLYSTHLVHEKRLAAEISLFKLASALEKYYLVNNTYENASLEKLGFTTEIANNQYKLMIAKNTDVAFLIAAVPQGRQSHKDSCGTLMLDSTNKKSITGHGDSRQCWQ